MNNRMNIEKVNRKEAKKGAMAVIAFIVIIIGLWTGELTIEYADGEISITETDIVFLSGDIEPITGIMLTSPNKDNREVWESYARATETYFWGWLYLLTKSEAKDMFKEMAEFGVDVRVLMENKQYKSFTKDGWNKLLAEFEGTDVKLKSDQHLGLNFNHTKTFVNDDYSIIQSANLTQSSFNKNTEHFFITNNESINENLVNLFEMDWNDVAYDDRDIHPNLLVCPINCRTKIESLISGAEESVYVMHQYLTDDALYDIVDSKIDEGIDVRFVLSDNDDNYLLLRDRGDDVVTIQKKPYVHTKMILVDEKYLIIGSMNLSTNALDRNREIGIVVTDQNVIRDFLSQM